MAFPDTLRGMPFYRFQQSIQTADNVAANYATNTFHFFADDVAALSGVVTAVAAFYNGLSDRFSSLVRQNGHTYKIYDLADPEPRAPVLEGGWNFTVAPASTPMPPEVSLCMSFQATKQSGVPQARKRNRIYLPFIRVDQQNTDGRPTAAMVTDLALAGDALLAASDAATTWIWSIFSTIIPINAAPPVNNGWVDNEWDTQRRRGRVAVSRTIFN